MHPSIGFLSYEINYDKLIPLMCNAIVIMMVYSLLRILEVPELVSSFIGGAIGGLVFSVVARNMRYEVAGYNQGHP